MQAVVFDGDLRVVDDYPEPRPGKNEVLVVVSQAGICATDLEIVRGYLGFQGVLGHEFVGTVVEGPPEILGQRVVGEINCVCHQCDMCRSDLENHCRRRTVLGIMARDGAFAEFLTLPRENLHLVPPELSDDQAVFVEPLAAALQAKRQYEFKSGERVAVLGCGRLGLLVTQVLRPLVRDVRLFARSQSKAGVCRELGLTLDALDEWPEGVFDVVVDCTGSPDGFASAQRLVKPRGTIILKSTYAGPTGPNLGPTVINEIRILGSRCGPFPEAIECLRKGRVRVEPMISGRYPLEKVGEAFAEASRPENVKILLTVRPR